MDNVSKKRKKMILLYNVVCGNGLSLADSDVPADWIITTERCYFQRADAVVFLLPDLLQDLGSDLDKREGQIWIAWYDESEKNHPWIRSQEMKDTFDLWMSYRQDADVVYPQYRYEYLGLFNQQITATPKQNKTCLIIPKKVISGFMENMNELIKYTPIDVFGSLYNKKQLPADGGSEKRLDIYRKYKFVISFENALDKDFITNKFYEPLLAGSIPIYLGAPNIDEFVPGDNCFVDVRQFENPQLLAHFLNSCYEDEQLYTQFHSWKNQPLRPSFVQKVEIQKEHPLVRLCQKLSAL